MKKVVLKEQKSSKWDSPFIGISPVLNSLNEIVLPCKGNTLNI